MIGLSAFSRFLAPPPVVVFVTVTVCGHEFGGQRQAADSTAPQRAHPQRPSSAGDLRLACRCAGLRDQRPTHCVPAPSRNDSLQPKTPGAARRLKPLTRFDGLEILGQGIWGHPLCGAFNGSHFSTSWIRASQYPHSCSPGPKSAAIGKPLARRASANERLDSMRTSSVPQQNDSAGAAVGSRLASK